MDHATRTEEHEYVSEVAETSLGPVEYAVVGSGTPVVLVHGSPGGIDAAALMARILPRDRVSAILLSRPGYLRTPLEGRTTIDAQADLLAALLDHLGIERDGVYSRSGGGPAGYRFAVRHPERVSCLIANAAVSQAYEAPTRTSPPGGCSTPARDSGCCGCSPPNSPSSPSAARSPVRDT